MVVHGVLQPDPMSIINVNMPAVPGGGSECMTFMYMCVCLSIDTYRYLQTYVCVCTYV